MDVAGRIALGYQIDTGRNGTRPHRHLLEKIEVGLIQVSEVLQLSAEVVGHAQLDMHPEWCFECLRADGRIGINTG